MRTEDEEEEEDREEEEWWEAERRGGAFGQTLNRRTEKEKMVTDIFNSVKMVKCQVIY